MDDVTARPRSPEELIAELRGALEPLGDASTAGSMAAYMRDQFPFLGVTAADRRAAQKPTLVAAGAIDGDHLVDVAAVCWEQPEREFQYVGADALRRHQRLLDPVHLGAVENLIVERSWWDTIDSLAPHTVGPLVRRHPELVEVIDRWIDDENIWLARSALIHQLMAKEATDAERLFAYVRHRAGDTEFFIRKAAGWALRQYARVDPDAVRAFVAANESILSGLTKREAMKHLDRAQRGS